MVSRWISDFVLGIKAYLNSFVFVFQNNLWYFFAFPAIFTVAIFIEEGILTEELENVNYADFSADPKIRDYSILIISIKGILYFVTKYLYRNVVLILSVPFLAALSVATEKVMTGNRYPFSFKQLLRDIRRGANIAATNLVLQVIIVAIWYLLTLLLPVIDPASRYVVFCVGFYFYGFSLMDYTNERRRLDIQQSIRFIRFHSGMAIAIGGVFSCLFLIPFAGVIIAPITGVVAATIAIHERVNLKRNKFAVRDDKGNTVRKAKTK